jgi:hypothetical protein
MWRQGQLKYGAAAKQFHALWEIRSHSGVAWRFPAPIRARASQHDSGPESCARRRCNSGLLWIRRTILRTPYVISMPICQFWKSSTESRGPRECSTSLISMPVDASTGITRAVYPWFASDISSLSSPGHSDRGIPSRKRSSGPLLHASEGGQTEEHL